MVLVSFVSYGQVHQVVNKTTSSTNPVKLTYEKDEFTGKEYLMTETDLLVSDDGKKGFKLYPRFKKENGKWNYTGIGGVSTIGNCFENDKVYIIPQIVVDKPIKITFDDEEEDNKNVRIIIEEEDYVENDLNLNF
jgi:hypothetical protein